MANRRRTHSTSQPDCRQPIVSNKPKTFVSHVCPQSRALLLALALVSCLISINCASSYGNAINKRSWRQPLGDLDYQLGRLTLTKDQQRQSQLSPPALSIELGDELGDDATGRQFGQLSLAPQPAYEGQFGDYPLAAGQQVLLAPPAEDPQQIDADYSAARLLELLRATGTSEANKLLAASAPASSSANDYDSLALADLSPSTRYTTDPKATFYFSSPDQEQSEPSDQVELVPLGRSESEKREQQRDELVRDLYRLEALDTSTSSTTPSSAKLTTLLEDEQADSPKDTKEAKSGDQAGASSNSTSAASQASSTPTPTPTSTTTISKDGQSGAAKEGVLSRVYGSLLGYLPFLAHLHRQSAVGSSTVRPTSVEVPTTASTVDLGTTSGTTVRPTEPPTTTTSTQSTADKRAADIRPVSTKLVVSTLVDSDEAASVRSTNDKHEKRQHNKDRTKSSQSDDLADSDEPQPDNEDFDEQHQLFDAAGSSISVRGPIEEVKIRHRVPVANYEPAGRQPSAEHKVSLVRQSSLMMPFRSQDELLVSSSSQPHESLVGKYIYAPEHHFRLDDERAHLQPVGQVSQRSSSRTPTDDLYRPYTASLQQRVGHQSAASPDDGGYLGYHANMNNNNDIYFLVMVASFCGMAMAVVLAAGLFAYRVQQSRKSTCESDYPTYGVVGPNNMSSKCVGGGPYVASYLGGAGCQGGLSPGVGKLGGLKGALDGHIYGPGASISADSGLATGGKPGSKRVSNGDQASTGSGSACSRTAGLPSYAANQNAARMYHYQHQKQQMISSDRASTGRHTSASDLDSDDDIDEGNYTVFECSGLASAHDMEIKNPLFNEAQSP